VTNVQLRTIKAGDGPLLKEITLRSVEEAPYAFGGVGTLDEERRRPDSQWDDLAAECGGDVEAWRDRCIGYFIMDGDSVCGKALGYLSGKTPRLAHMSGVWIDPRYRRRRLGRWLVMATCDWASSKGARRLQLWVDDTNPAGVAFYASLGFRATGDRRRINPNAVEEESSFELALPLAPSTPIS
jgi:ribosomal protein S18 acetylase RimI-like enzyme